MKFVTNILEKLYNDENGTAWFMALVASYAVVRILYIAVGR